MSDNRLKGIIPSQLFSLSSLSVLAVGVNCFSIHESISDAICVAKNMTTLTLDGLQTALASCRGSPVISIPALHCSPGTYTIPATELATSIPKYIFQLSQLEVL